MSMSSKREAPVDLWSLEEKLAQHPIHCYLLFYWLKQPQNPESRAGNIDLASWWEKYQRLCGCHTFLSTSFHLKPRLLPQLLSKSPNLLQPNHPPWELLKSYMPLSVCNPAVCLALSQDRYSLKRSRDNFERNCPSAIGVLLDTQRV